ncbi:tropomyosin-1, isoforms 33/34 isoform X4 [Nilaparvata lugens]|uniref:tropomyosin-1, isoforms 33/34 isoform X4 n=1 Tax=Nilaparvata lugens TaxID=108931 RepID=UPI00193D09BC|nr:tropomyosin-1, isoforms 33/34 isoform X4 [Nilaparvata lugens]
MADDEKRRIDEAKKAKQAEIDRKRAEVRKRMEEASKAKKAKKGFMTPDRKKKLRLLLRKKAAEELKKEQERKAAERRRIIEERCGKAVDLDDGSEELIKKTLEHYHERIIGLESDKVDLEQVQKEKAERIADLNSQVNDLRGKFVKPTLKKVSKYENKFAKLQKKAAEFNFRNQLKVVKKKEFTLEEEDKEKKGIVDWSKKDEKKDGGDGTPAEATEGAPDDGDLLDDGDLGEVEGLPVLDGEHGEGTPGEGEAPPEEPVEEVVPEEPPPPPHTEEDLWLYIKDTVISDNILTVEQLMEKLVEAVSKVPASYLEPVVEASIKRSQSLDLGTLTGGEPKPEGAEGEAPPTDGSAPPADGVAPPADGTAPPADGTPPADGAAPPADGAAPPAYGAAPPADGAAPPADGAAPPADGAAPPADGAAPLADGAAPPADGAAPPTDRAAPLADGAVPPADGAAPAADATPTEAAAPPTEAPATEAPPAEPTPA